MCKELCDADGEMQSCQDCGRLICFDVNAGDDIIRPAWVTSSGDLFCDRCGSVHDRAEEEEFDEPWEEELALEDLPRPAGGEARHGLPETSGTTSPTRIFTNCNVCGIKLRTEAEDRMGMCERCCAEGP